jgi:hypothetical protein
VRDCHASLKAEARDDKKRKEIADGKEVSLKSGGEKRTQKRRKVKVRAQFLNV